MLDLRSGVYTPLGIWQLFFTNAILEQFVINTNSFANRRLPRWTSVTIAELKQFFACLYLLGINGCPRMRDAFESEMHAIPMLNRIMKRHRFEAIMSNWHWIDTSAVSSAEKATKKAHDAFWKVSTLCEEISLISQSLWQLGQSFDIDEQTIPMKGRHKCRCYNPNKP